MKVTNLNFITLIISVIVFIDSDVFCQDISVVNQFSQSLQVPIKVNQEIKNTPFYLKIDSILYQKNLSSISKEKNSSIDALNNILDSLRSKQYEKVLGKYEKKEDMTSDSKKKEWENKCERISNSMTKDARIVRLFKLGDDNTVWSVIQSENKLNYNYLLFKKNTEFVFNYISEEPLFRLLASFNRNECKLEKPIKDSQKQNFDFVIPLTFKNKIGAAICFDAYKVNISLPLKNGNELNDQPFKGAIVFLSNILNNLYSNKISDQVFSQMGEITSRSIQRDIETYSKNNALEQYLSGWFSSKKIRLIVDGEDMIYIFCHENDIPLDMSSGSRLTYYVLHKNDEEEFQFVNYHYIQGLDSVLMSDEFQYAVSDLLNQ